MRDNETKQFEDINKVRLTKTLQRTLSKKSNKKRSKFYREWLQLP